MNPNTTSTVSTVWNPPPAVCPSCGRCHVCGRPGWSYWPSYQPIISFTNEPSK